MKRKKKSVTMSSPVIYEIISPPVNVENVIRGQIVTHVLSIFSVFWTRLIKNPFMLIIFINHVGNCLEYNMHGYVMCTN